MPPHEGTSDLETKFYEEVQRIVGPLSSLQIRQTLGSERFRGPMSDYAKLKCVEILLDRADGPKTVSELVEVAALVADAGDAVKLVVERLRPHLAQCSVNDLLGYFAIGCSAVRLVIVDDLVGRADYPTPLLVELCLECHDYFVQLYIMKRLKRRSDVSSDQRLAMARGICDPRAREIVLELIRENTRRHLTQSRDLH